MYWSSLALALALSIKLSSLSQSTWVRLDDRVEGRTLEVNLFDPGEVSLET